MKKVIVGKKRRRVAEGERVMAAVNHANNENASGREVPK